MKRPVLLPAVIAILLAGSLAGLLLTRDTASRGLQKPSQTSQQLIDDRLLQTAHGLAATADTSDEETLARECLGLADHETDQEFATRLRETASAAPLQNGPSRALPDRIARLQKQAAADQVRVNQLSAENSDELDIAKAHLALDQDDLDDAKEDLARQGGDMHATLERALQEHENAQHEAAPPKVVMAGNARTLLDQVRLDLGLRDRAGQLASARQQALDKAAALQHEHDALENGAATPQADSLASLRRLADARKTASELDKRIQDCQQLASVYQQWMGVVASRRRAAVHQMLGSVALVLAVLLLVVLIDRTIRRAFRRQQDARRLHQLRSLATIAVQVVGALVILIILFGPPTQLSTIIGLTTAGLTVALKDFIVAFFGWFALLGRNGLRIGDWVEINGVGGEVVEIGLLKTTLLEMGDWANTGHPTGRRVSFVNSFAIEGHYFNFSTAGQWLWDELQVLVPVTGDPYHLAQEIRDTVERETENDVQQAEVEWERATRQYGLRAFPAKPAVDLRPSELGNGLTVAVRYITRAPQRYQVKARLFEAIVGLLHHRKAASSQ